MAYIDLLGHQRALNAQGTQDYFRAIDTARALADAEDRNFESDRNFGFTAGRDARDASRTFYNDQLARKIDARDFSARRSDVDRAAELNRDYFDFQKSQPTRSQAQQERDLLTLAEQDANEGIFEPEKYAGALTPVQIQVLTRRNVAARVGPTDEYNYFKNAAETLNNQAVFTGDIAGLKSDQSVAPSEPGFFRKYVLHKRFSPDENTPTKEDIQEQIDYFVGEQAKLKPALDRFATDKKLSSGVTLDPATGQYRATQRPIWMGDSATAVAPVATPSAARVARPITRAEVEALPSGAPFVNPADGKTYYKK